jgi:hypothetical protein
MFFRQKPILQPTECTALLHPPLNPPLALFTTLRHCPPPGALSALFKRYERTTCLANTLLAAVQGTYYRIVPYPFYVLLLARIEEFRPQLLMATERFKEIEWIFRSGVYVDMGGEVGRKVEWEIGELEGLLVRAQEDFNGS